jgi:hypothetical protein
MKTINFSEEEISFLRHQYIEELNQAEQYVDQIKNVLKKLGGSAKTSKRETISEEPKIGKKRGPKPKVKAVEITTLRKRGRKPKVEIIETKTSKKRGRPKKILVTQEVIALPKKRGRKPKSSFNTIESIPSIVNESFATKMIIGNTNANPAKKEEKIRKKKSNRKYRTRGRVNLVSLRKPLKLK